MRLALIVILAWSLAGCAKNELIVLLPDENGEVGALDVSNKGGTVALTEALAAARAGEDSVEATKVSQDEVQKTFAAALAAEPPAPVSYVLYFRSGTTTLMAGSEAQLRAMLADARGRAAVDIQVTGHTDTVGSLERNDRLALKRAEAVVAWLIRDSGVDPQMIRAVGRGEREPLVPTGDNVAEARNRRVEIFVR